MQCGIDACWFPAAGWGWSENSQAPYRGHQTMESLKVPLCAKHLEGAGTLEGMKRRYFKTRPDTNTG